jgi:hypothetical protein
MLITFYFKLIKKLSSISGGWSPAGSTRSARRPLIDLLYLTRVITRMENLVEWWLVGEIDVLGENLLQGHFVHHANPLWPDRPRTRPTAVGSQRLTAWAMARPSILSYDLGSEPETVEYVVAGFITLRDVRWLIIQWAAIIAAIIRVVQYLLLPNSYLFVTHSILYQFCNSNTVGTSSKISSLLQKPAG